MTRFLGVLLLAGLIVLWVASSELTKYIFANQSFNKPLFVTYLDASSFVTYLYGALCFRQWRMVGAPVAQRRDESTSLLQQVQGTESALASRSHAGRGDLDRGELFQVAGVFATLWFMANFLFNVSLNYTSVGSNTMLSSSSGLFTFLIGAVVPGPGRDTRHWPLKLALVAGTLGGVALVSLADAESENVAGTDSVLGDLLAIASAALYGVYTIYYRRKVGNAAVSTPLFLGIVGGMSFLGFWPLFFVLHYSGFELFEVPTPSVWLSLLLNSVLGTLVSELLWLRATVLTSPVVATLALTLTIPLAIAADAAVRVEHVAFSPRYIGGALLLAACFLGCLALQWVDVLARLTNNYRRSFV